MLQIQLIQRNESKSFSHDAGPLEFGRGPRRGAPRIQLEDPSISRDQLRLDPLASGQVRAENLSGRNVIHLSDGATLKTGEAMELSLPARLSVNGVVIQIDGAGPSATPSAGDLATPSTPNLAHTLEPSAFADSLLMPLTPEPARPKGVLGDISKWTGAETLAACLDTIVSLERAGAGSKGFYDELAVALVGLIGLDLGLVLIHHNQQWNVRGSSVASDQVPVTFSRSLLRKILQTRQSYYQDLKSLAENAPSLSGIEALVAAPIFGVQGEVVGVLYGTRYKNVTARGGISKIEAQLVQLLATVAGAHLARTEAVRTRIHFEQFFPPELVRELEQNPQLLEGRAQEVTVLVGDLRGFTRVAERLGAEQTCRLVRDVMDAMSARILEHGGVIVSYAGDGLLAMWNAPRPQADHAQRACDAALSMLAEMPKLNATWAERIGMPLVMGFGLNTGLTHVGNTGSRQRFAYGPLGHAVNLASRLQSASKRLCLPLLISESVVAQLTGDYAVRRLGRFRLAGVQAPVMLYELYGKSPLATWSARRNTYETALKHFEDGRWTKACQNLVGLLDMGEARGSDDATIHKLLQVCLGCLGAPPREFAGVIDAIEK